MAFWKDRLARNRRLIFYCVIGASGATLDFLIYSSLVKAAEFPVQPANLVGYTCGTLWSFFLNSRFNFKLRDWLALRLVSFCGVAFLGWAASAGILYVTVNRLGWDKYLAKLATIVVVVLVQYNLNRLVSFRKSRGPEN